MRSLFMIIAMLALPLAAQAEPAYLNPLAPGWEVKAILTVGEAAQNGYRMAGIPDGLGAFDNGDGTFTLLMNHELAADKGVLRAHGVTGAFVSRWVIDAETLSAQSGRDLVRTVWGWSVAEGRHVNLAGGAFNRLCSADLPPASAVYNTITGLGYDGRLFLNGEEDAKGGRAFAHTLQGDSYELPDLGHVAWENLLLHPDSGDRTLVIGLDDSHDGLVLVYVGDKRSTGNPAERAGLVAGRLHALRADGGRFSLAAIADAAKLEGNALRAQARQSGASGFARPEDGAWDTRDPNVFYFATTDRIGGNSQLFRLTFDDVHAPERGGRIDAVLKARDIGAEMFDNLTVDGDGRVLIEEDPGGNARLSAIWLYDPKRDGALKLFEANPALFAPEGSSFMTTDEEHSGIVEVTSLLKKASWFNPQRRYYLGTTQSHLKHPDASLVEHGQLWLISGPADKAITH